MLNTDPIGIFDSGVGGLSIARRVREILPNENILYLADSAHAPYGTKSETYTTQRSSLILNFLMKKKVKAIVIACNTATASSIENLRSKYTVPIIGVEPGIKPAALKSTSGVVGVLATSQTLNSLSFGNLSNRFSSNIKIEIQPCPGLVEQVEKVNLYSIKTQDMIKQYVFPLLEKGADNIVLGCTHYGFLESVIKKVVGQEVGVINTDLAVARQVARILQAEKILTASQSVGNEEFWTSGDHNIASRQFSALWGKQLNALKFFT